MNVVTCGKWKLPEKFQPLIQKRLKIGFLKFSHAEAKRKQIFPNLSE